MKLLKSIVLSAGMILCALPAEAIIAKRDVRTITQPDGTTLRIKVVGDERMHFTTAEDGTLLKLNDNGFYTLGNVAPDGAVVATPIRYEAGKAFAEAINIKDVDMTSVQTRRSSRQRAPQSGIGLTSTTYPRTGSPKGLVILVQYSDVKFTLSNPASYFNDMINGDNFTQYGGTGSALQYFTEQSGGKFIPSFDVYGPVTLPNNRKYYGGNDRWGEDQNPHLMVTHAIDILDKDVNFAQYDTDGDGLIDNVYIFYAGQGEASYGSEDTVWPHSWDVREAGVKKKVDGVTIAHYACSNEWEYNRPDGIGTFVHEFSHVMGLPDLYHTTQLVYYTPSEYSVLDYGPYNNDGRTPPNYSAYEKNAMGWYEPIMLDGPNSVTLAPISTGEFGLIPTSKNTEFYLLENRQLEGWDAYIPNHGMLIWHIDYVASVFENNVVNNTRNHQYVDLVEANNTPDGSSGTTLKGWPFPGSTNKTEFTSSTLPALKEWSGKAIDLPVTEITEKSGLISFKIAGGAPSLSQPVGFVNDTERDPTYFTARWNAVEGATDYLLTVYAQANTDNINVITCTFDSSKIPSGWTATTTSTSSFYTSYGNFGSSSPSYKISTNNQTLTSPEVNGNVTEISFWGKGQSTDTNTNISIEGQLNGKWEVIDKYYPDNNKATTFSVSNIPKGVNRVRFTLDKSGGNVAIDDIKISYADYDDILPDYNGISTGGQTSYRVDKLKTGVKKYYFTVQAVSDTEKSLVSEPVHVELSTSGIGNISIDAAEHVEYYNLQGVRVDEPIPGTLMIRRQGNETSKIIVK